MPRLSKFDIATRDALNVLKSVSKKLDPRTTAKYERQIANATRIDYVNRIIAELNAIKTGSTATAFKQEQQEIRETKRQQNIASTRQQQRNIITENVIDRNVVTMTSTVNTDFTYLTHEIEIRRMKLKHPEALFSHQVIYYKDNVKDDSNIIFYKKPEIKKTLFKKIEMQNSDEYFWYPRSWTSKYDINGLVREDHMSYKVEIITTAYHQIQQNIINNVYRNQIYQLNDNGTCVYDGFVSFFTSKLEKNPKDRQANMMLNRLIKNKDTYAKAYTNETIHEIGELCQTTIYIIDVVNGNDKKYNDKNVNKYSIEFINSKYNHLDLLSNANNVIEVEKDEYLKLKDDSRFYIERMGKLITPSQSYKCKQTEFKEIYNEWKQSNNYDSYYIINGSESYNLIENYDYSLHTFFDEDMYIKNDLYSEIDQKKAYYNSTIKNNNKNYIGFPSGSFITVSNFTSNDFDIITKNNLIGFFEVKIISHIDKSYHSDKLGLVIGSNHVFTTVQILFLQKYIEFQFINASYSPSIDIPFTDKFLKKEDKISHYCKAFGLMLHQNNTIETVIKPYDDDKQYYNIIGNDNKEMYKMDDGCIKIVEQLKEVKSYLHLAYFMNSYCKVNNLEVMYNNDIDCIVGVKVDSIVYKKNYDIVYDNTIFRPKDTNIEFLKQDTKHIDVSSLDFGLDDLTDDITITHKDEYTYFRSYFKPTKYHYTCSNSFLQTGEIINNRTILINGKGGSGKTYSILNSNLNIKNIVYTSSCWNLINGQKEKTNHKIIGMSYQRLLGIDTEQFKSKNIKSVIVDELTLIDEKIVNRLRKMFYWCFIFIIGDVENDIFYQCSLPNVKVINPKDYSDIQQVKYLKSYRFDSELNQKLDALRKIRLTYSNRTDINYIIKNYVYENFKECLKTKDEITFNNDDIGISGADDLGEKSNNLTTFFIGKGAEPQYFVKKTDIYKGMMKGQQLPAKPDHSNYEMKLFKTIHSFQGLDLTETNKIIIGIKHNFDANLFYTALSRARRLDQINIIIDV